MVARFEQPLLGPISRRRLRAMSKVTKAIEVLGAILGVSAVILVSFGLANHVHGQQFAGVMCVVGWAFIWLFYFILHPMAVALEDKFVEPARETREKTKR